MTQNRTIQRRKRRQRIQLGVIGSVEMVGLDWNGRRWPGFDVVVCERCLRDYHEDTSVVEFEGA